eukprot:scaffold108827_cov46-Prasinocladus_malaysianus.AAC.6
MSVRGEGHSDIHRGRLPVCSLRGKACRESHATQKKEGKIAHVAPAGSSAHSGELISFGV